MTTRIKITEGVYRVGAYVVIREDYPSVGDYDEMPRDVTWGVIDGDFYDDRGEDVGLPDAIHETGTLRDAVAWIENQS